jgi:DNA-binding NarL/FixJ family response regulator
MATLSYLTPRETESFQLVLIGWTNKAISMQFASQKTVEFPLPHIYTKMTYKRAR